MASPEASTTGHSHETQEDGANGNPCDQGPQPHTFEKDNGDCSEQVDQDHKACDDYTGGEPHQIYITTLSIRHAELGH